MDDDPKRGADFTLGEGSTEAEAVERFYDDWAETYDETLRGWRYRAPERTAAALAPHLATGARVLDVGCGTGMFAEALAAEGDFRLDGLDISGASLEIAARTGRYDRLIRHDLQRLPLPVATDACDAAASVGVLTYVADVEGLMRDVVRCVRPGGAVAFTQRSDRWESAGFPEMLARLEEEGLWTPLQVGEPRPYLPGNREFGERVGVVHVLCRID
ncbi:MAG: methyltransferase domain-containing protein [Paracoccaceae bacterium]